MSPSPVEVDTMPNSPAIMNGSTDRSRGTGVPGGVARVSINPGMSHKAMYEAMLHNMAADMDAVNVKRAGLP